MDIKEILNIKDSTRNLSNEEFERVLPDLAKQLENVSYIPHYTEKELRDDWKKLCSYKNTAQFTSAIVRPGAKLCEHFFPNFWTIKNSKGESFTDYWKAEKLEKILRWNRSSHSTPYLSELKRGVFFCHGLTKNTMYRPHLAKMICDYYKPGVVLDPCAGWGGRMLGVVASGAKYVAFETNTLTYNYLLELSQFLNISDKVTLFNCGAEKLDQENVQQIDLILTSPPYFNLEIYTSEKNQSENMFNTYKEWKDLWLADIVNKSIKILNTNGVSCWNVQNVKNMPIFDDIIKIHQELNFIGTNYFGLSSSARPSNQNIDKNKKTENITVCFSKN